MNLFSLIKSKLAILKLTPNTIIMIALGLFFLFIIFYNLFGKSFEGMTDEKDEKKKDETAAKKDGDATATTAAIPSGTNSAELLNAINSLLQKTNLGGAAGAAGAATALPPPPATTA